MIRARENPIAIQAGVLALLMHGLFLFVLIFSFSWKHVQPPAVSEVELWDNLPKQEVVTPPPAPEPEPPPPPPPEIKPEIKPEPQPEPPPEPKAEIQLKPKPVEVKKPPKQEPKKPDPAIKKQAEEKKRKDELDKLKQAMLQDVPDHVPEDETPAAPAVDTKTQAAQQAADAKRAEEILAASNGVINEYIAKITAKILSKVNSAACGSGKPSLTFTIALQPDGHVNGAPQQTKSSGLPACDLEVEHAILLAQPLPLPPQRELFDQFRTLNLTFRPNGK